MFDRPSVTAPHALTAGAVHVLKLGDFGHGPVAACHNDASRADEIIAEKRGIAGLNADAGIGAGCMDKAAVTDIDASVIASAATPEGDNVACAHFADIHDAVSHEGLFPRRTGKVDSHRFVRPSYEAGTVKSGKGFAAENVGSAHSPVGAPHQAVLILFSVILCGDMMLGGILVVLRLVREAAREKTDEQKREHFKGYSHILPFVFARPRGNEERKNEETGWLTGRVPRGQNPCISAMQPECGRTLGALARFRNP